MPIERASRPLRAALAALVASSVLVAAKARADEPSFSVIGAVGSGIEGGGRDYAAGMRRARTSLRFGGDVRLYDASPDIFGLALTLEVEPHTAAGVDFRYTRLANTRLAVFLAASAIWTPHTLFGVGGGAEYRYPLRPTVSFTVGPSVMAFVAGTDLPQDTVIWQGLLQAGFRAHLF